MSAKKRTTNKRTPPEGDTYNHLLVLAENEEGYRNLVKIVSEASLNGFYYKPRVSKRYLAEHSKGLVGLSACLKGEVAESLTEGKYDAASRLPAPSKTSLVRGTSSSKSRTRDGAGREGILRDHFRLRKRDLACQCRDQRQPLHLRRRRHAQDVMLCIQTGKSIQRQKPHEVRDQPVFRKGRGRDGESFRREPDV